MDLIHKVSDRNNPSPNAIARNAAQWQMGWLGYLVAARDREFLQLIHWRAVLLEY